MSIRACMAVSYLLVAVSVSGLIAQSASASVTAVVQQPITVTKTADLAFGNVFPGINKTVAPADAGAASFTIQGQAGTNVSMTFSLPATLANGGNTLTIASWTGTYATTATPAGTSFTPSPSAVTPTLSGTGGLYVYIGAMVQPTTSQVAATYTGTATITVTY